MYQTTLKIDGMMCGMCESHINDTIRKAVPVKKVTSSHAKGEAVVLTDEPLDIEAVKAAGYTKVILRPLMVVAGDHANNDMAGSDDDSWLSMFNASDAFESVDCQIAGLGEIEDVQKLYVAHTKAAIDSLNG